MKKRWVNILIIIATIIVFFLLLSREQAQASRESCECRELRAIRVLLQHQLGIICNESRCLPVPTPTNDGGPLE